MKIAITGGIGSGKSYICRMLAGRGIQVYDCDAAAKRLMAGDKALQDAISLLTGQKVYEDGVLQKKVLARYLLNNEGHRQALNDVIHPVVASDFVRSGKDWLESAIFFDSGFNRRVNMDVVVCVSAPMEVRIQRVMSRDGISRGKALQWIRSQLPQEEVEKRSDLVIINDGKVDLKGEVERLFQTLAQWPIR
ncbi:MAG: dephospho-CoA kinase [Prevotella sp.]|jgi:dephospho-CoA kinase|nr:MULTISPECIES: dephospho-CoA kinase [unclassified Prevotella]MCH3970522.1 dephospho-CoA kinase [Prevotella sp.]MCH3986150.1 dephospho-CoA kinase [Prevotella sp.]MCH3992959.1 dephospho-CoA kinase [Prevotella sp.]MCH4018110.1 dephospho-CoA kinase [Prevotella sp.]MCH4186954.1 dephospho-CoA kinase [Prevotella sp.]